MVATLPLRFLKARRHLNYVRAGQQGGGENAREPTVGTIGPCPDLDPEGRPPNSEQERKRHCADGAGPSPVPREEREPTDSPLTPPWTLRGEPVSKERAALREGYCGCFPDP